MANCSAFLQVKVSIVVLEFCGLVRHCTSLHGPAKQATTLCTAATQLSELAHNSAAILDTVMDKVTQLQLEEQKLRPAALSFSEPTKSAAITLAATWEQRALTLSRKLKQKLPAVTDGVAAVSRLSGSAKTLSELATLQLEDINKITANTFATISSTKIKFKVAPKQHGACNKGKEQREEKSEGTTTKPSNVDEISVVTAEVPAEQTTAGNALTVCGHPTNNGAITGQSDCQDGQAAQIGIKGGIVLKITTAQTHIAPTPSGDKAYTAVSAGTKIPSDKTHAAELKLVSAMITAARELETATALPDPNADYDDTNLKDTIAKTLGGAETTATKAELKPVVDRAAKELFGEKGETITATMPKSVKGFKPWKAAIGDERKPLDSISDPDVLYKAAIYYTVKNFIDDQEQKKKNQANPSCPTNAEKPAEEPKKTADECKKHTTAEDCKKEKGCDFDEKKDPKCFPKAETDKKDEKSFCSNVRVSVPQVFAAFVAFLF
uniref:Variant surface glycoprotein 1125.4228 n=1 Tax=Trypanosoma brucei TaxID=5691 RepID=A0A1J0RA88_9TRYP|nr:variant surface glycoprotein 1125.4228 [Trypanosoma brucei]